MAFTTNQVKEMAERLKAYGIKDSQFDAADEIKDDDIIAIVQDDVNKTVSIGGLATYIIKAIAITDEEIDAIIDGTDEDTDTGDTGGDEDGCCCEGVPEEEMEEYLENHGVTI